MVNIYKLKLTVLQQEILRFLFIKAGKTFNARQIALTLEVSQPAIGKALPLLEKEGFAIVKKEAGRFSIELNRDKPEVLGLKRADNLKQLYETGLVQFLYDQFPGACIILFGSYALGEDTLTSDIDLAVIGIKEKQLELAEFEKLLERDIRINYYPSLRVIDKPLLHNLLNGIVLKGTIDYENL